MPKREIKYAFTPPNSISPKAKFYLGSLLAKRKKGTVFEDVITDILRLAENLITEEGRHIIMPKDIAIVISHDINLKDDLNIKFRSQEAKDLYEIAQRLDTAAHKPKESRGEHYQDFFDEYSDNFEAITQKVMKKLGESGAVNCGDIVNNIKDILAVGKSKGTFHSQNVVETIDHMKEQLQLNRLLIVQQDAHTQDHLFAVIGDMPNIHIIEFKQDVCNFSETMSLDDFLDEMIDILWGYEPDRFYGIAKKHDFRITSYDRKVLSKNTIVTFLRPKKLPKRPSPKLSSFEESSVPSEPVIEGFNRKERRRLVAFEKFRNEIIKNMDLDPDDYDSNLILLDLFNHKDSDVALETLEASREVARVKKGAKADKKYYKKNIKKAKEEEEGEDYMDAEDLEQSLLPPVRRALIDVSQVRRAPIGISGVSKVSTPKSLRTSRTRRSKPQEAISLDLTQKGKIIKLPPSVTTATSSTSAMGPNFKGYGRVKKGLMWR